VRIDRIPVSEKPVLIKRFALALLVTASLFSMVGCRHRCNSVRDSNADCLRD